MEMNFCRRCGNPLKRDGASYVCTKGHLLFANSAPAQGLLLVKDRQVLLAERAVDPGKGKLDMPGGYCEWGETFEAATARELKEEVGLGPSDHGDLHYLFSHAEPYEFDGEKNNVLGVVYWAELGPQAKITLGDDLAGHYEWVDSKVAPERLAFEAIGLGLARLKALGIID